METGDEVLSHVVSRDGTEIAIWSTGQGSPLVAVHGFSADHTRWRPLLPPLERYFTVHAMDRRGRGGSGDGPEYDLAREFEDVAAVVDGVARAAGRSVDVYGHSLGGLCAFGAAALTSNIHKLVLYEGWPVPHPEVFALPTEHSERLDALLAAGEREATVETFLREVLALPDDEVAALKAAPSWPGRVAAAHTIPRECRAVAAAEPDPAMGEKIKVPVLLLVGEHSTQPSRAIVEAVAGTLPDARIAVIPGQGHVADVLAPEAFADRLRAFLLPPP